MQAKVSEALQALEEAASKLGSAAHEMLNALEECANTPRPVEFDELPPEENDPLNAQQPPAPLPPQGEPTWPKLIEWVSSTYGSHSAHDAVAQDMHGRNAQGTRKYGVPLHPFNGRDHLVDAYQELLDCAAYLMNEIVLLQTLPEDDHRRVDIPVLLTNRARIVLSAFHLRGIMLKRDGEIE